MYKGKKTLFWDGQNLWNGVNFCGWPLIYDKEERNSWEVIVVLPGVEVIPQCNFCGCTNVKIVIMVDTVKRIEDWVFSWCSSLEFVKLSRNLEYIGNSAFYSCDSLTSIFIPPSCREIGIAAFDSCTRLIIFNVPHQTQLGESVIANTALLKASAFPSNENGQYENHDEVHEWVKNRNADDRSSLHQACASSNQREEVIFNIIKRQGIGAFEEPDSVGVTPLQYLVQNPFVEMEEQTIIKRYILDMMGEIVV
ncbi:hypothetical protein CTEN210_18403 [Chaetoceros tenuissimus]|uniref:Leucine-rich repeat domain-containing protein n=1 Tax=Chaetoceros tenuissimus TaxID=426638 RepID=A0AAD3DDF2_9STRA|nr:hypothetical protein CTEN210_18403 [Chaetoceros tenuissimus]